MYDLLCDKRGNWGTDQLDYMSKVICAVNADWDWKPVLYSHTEKYKHTVGLCLWKRLRRPKRHPSLLVFKVPPEGRGAPSCVHPLSASSPEPHRSRSGCREQVCHCLSPPDTGNFGGLDKAAQNVALLQDWLLNWGPWLPFTNADSSTERVYWMSLASTKILVALRNALGNQD